MRQAPAASTVAHLAGARADAQERLANSPDFGPVAAGAASLTRFEAQRDRARELGAEAYALHDEGAGPAEIAAFYGRVSEFMAHWARAGKPAFLQMRSAYHLGLMAEGSRRAALGALKKSKRAVIEADDAAFDVVRGRARRHWGEARPQAFAPTRGVASSQIR